MFSEANINVKNAFLMKERVRSKPLVFLYIRKIIHCVKSGNNYVIIAFLLSRHHFISKTKNRVGLNQRLKNLLRLHT